jgi:P4 family phage/plasmid primase-like protien
MNPISSFYISSQDEKGFLEKYNDALQKGEHLHFTEKHRDVSPIVIDLDFRFEKEPVYESRQYTTDDIEGVIEVYLHELNKFVETSIYEVYIMEKPAPCVDEKKKIIKDGIHIMIPNIVTQVSFQLMLRQSIINKLGYLPGKLKTTNCIEDIIDKAVIHKNNWTMYGSRKPYNEPYLISHHWTFISNGDVEFTRMNNTVFTQEPWRYTSILSIRNKFIKTKIKEDKIDYLQELEDDHQDSMHKQTIVMRSQQNRVNNKVCSSLNYEVAQKLIKILSDTRAHDYQLWISVGWCARNIDNRLLSDWIEFSKRSSKYVDEQECENLWRYMRDSGLGIGTLCMWAKQDSIEEYNKIISTSLYTYLVNSANDTDYDIALVIYNKFKQDFVCASIKYKSWYEFKHHRWTKCEDGYVLKMKMSTDVCKEYLRIAAEFATKAAQTDDNDEQERFVKKGQIFSKIANKLKKTDFKDKMLKESSLQFFNEKFEDELLDSNPNLLAFENGVYDLQNLEFREGHPEDYISFSTKINYVEYNENDPYVEQIMDFMSKVLPKKEIREYVLTLMASMLDGNNKEEKFYIWTGHGSNGKSKCIELLEKVLGDYCCNFNISLLTSKRVGSSQTNSELVRAKGRRFAVLQEPEEGEKINAGFMKELSGNDKIIARGLYKESIEFKPMFKMVLTCNHLPSVPPEDGGTWRRIRLVEFNSHFCDNPNPNNKNEFHIDRELAFKFEEWKETFMAILIEYFKKYKEYGIFEPEEVLQCTKNYQRSNDIVGEFVDAFIKPDDESTLYLDPLYEEYKEWHKSENIVGKMLRKKCIKDYIDKHISKSVTSHNDTYWTGYSLGYSLKGADI